MQKLFKKLATTTPVSADIGLLIVRVWFGAVLALNHGWPKLAKLDKLAGWLGKSGFPMPKGMAILAFTGEFVGGLLLAIGLLTRGAAGVVMVTMVVAAFVIHGDDPFSKKEFALCYATAALAIVAAGPGKFSVDYLFFKSSR